MERILSIFSQNKLTAFILLSLGAHVGLFLALEVDLDSSIPVPESAVVRLTTSIREQLKPEPEPIPAEPAPIVQKELVEEPAVEASPVPKLLPAPPEQVIMRRLNAFQSVSVRPAPLPVPDLPAGPRNVQFNTAAQGAHIPKPAYPDIAKRWGHEGLVVVEILIAEDGTVEEAFLVESSGYIELDEAAMEVILNKWQFQAIGYRIRTVKEFEFKLRR